MINKLFKLLVTIIMTCLTIIILKYNQQLKNTFYNKVLSTNLSFADMNNWYQNTFGSIMPFDNIFEETEMVFNEKIEYTEIINYEDGIELKVREDYLIPSIDNGIVTFVGEKENYGLTVIIEQADGVVVWYSNLQETNVRIYDYINKGNLIGEVDHQFYMVFYKDGNIDSYEKYL